eukprot:scaffold194227_cov22-Prasinocladus_malaysianus.AAC.1
MRYGYLLYYAGIRPVCPLLDSEVALTSGVRVLVRVLLPVFLLAMVLLYGNQTVGAAVGRHQVRVRVHVATMNRRRCTRTRIQTKPSRRPYSI